ncbi:FAD-binding oxidoreductase [Saccharopolyspora sp. NPDC000995]
MADSNPAAGGDCSCDVDRDLNVWLAECEQLLGVERVERCTQRSLAERQRPSNIGFFRARHIPAVMRPRDVSDVQSLVRSLHHRETKAALYPVSQGRNWGFGSKDPVRDDNVVLDLGDLRRIRHLDLDSGSAIVETGVTQGELARCVAGTPFMLNVTSSSQHSSVIGNALERGVGTRRQRCDDIAGLEIVLASGQALRIGSWPRDGQDITAYRHELGPGLMPLFFQSNFGIITAAVVRLLPRPDSIRVLRLGFGYRSLPEVVGVLRGYHHQGLIPQYLKIFLDSADGPAAEPKCHAFTCIDGDSELVSAVTEILTRRVHASGLFTAIDELDHAHADRSAVMDALVGDPERNDQTLLREFGTTADGIDEDGAVGWLFYAPMIRFEPDSVMRAQSLLRQIANETGITWQAHATVVSTDLIDFVVAIKFPRTDPWPERAHHALDLMHERFPQSGFQPYRLDIDHMHRSSELHPDPAIGGFLSQLKGVFDPRGLIAPGRYLE